MRIRLLFPLAMMGLIGILLLIPLPHLGRIGAAISDLGHAPAFALLTYSVWWGFGGKEMKRPWLGAGLAWFLMVAFGLAGEYLQGWTNRNFSMQDALANTGGATAALLFILFPGSVLGKGIAVLVFLMAQAHATINLTDSLIQSAQLPLLAGFETPFEETRFFPIRASISTSGEHPASGNSALKIELQPGEASGIEYYWPPADWTPFQRIHCSLFLEGDQPVPMMVRIVDRADVVRVRVTMIGRFTLKPGINEISMPLKDYRLPPKKRLDLTRIVYLHLLALEQDAPRTIHLDELRLE